MLARPESCRLAVMKRLLLHILLAAALLGGALGGAGAQSVAPPRHGIAMHGTLKYAANFTHFDYVNPDAPKGGSVKYGAVGTSFDSLNPLILKGVPAAGLGLTFDSLMASSADEAFSLYGLIAESIEVPEDRSWAIFNLRAPARFHDGSPITADDVVFSFNILTSKGSPFFRVYFGDVLKAEALAPRRVKFTFRNADNRELPLIVAGSLPILSKAYWQGRDFDKTTLEPPLGSGAYRVASVDPGRAIAYERVQDYWAADLPVNRGRNNFDRIRYDYYRDAVVALEAFKAGEFDLRAENVSKNWAVAYDIAEVRNGLIHKVEFPHGRVTPLQGFVFNTRRDIFKDVRVREALGYAFDFEWTNKNIFYGAYRRTQSYFDNSELTARGLPEGAELAVLEGFRGSIPEAVFTSEYAPPKTDGSGNLRANLRVALRLLKAAGWEVRDGKQVNIASGQALSFEILIDSPAMERIVLPFIGNLKRLGVEAVVRRVDTAQYKNRLDEFDFDMTTYVWGQSLSPGNEQRDMWGSAAATTPGSQNLPGIEDPVVDKLIERVIAAPDRAALVARVRALDRVLSRGFYLIPHFHTAVDRIAYWDKFGLPETVPMQGVQINAWWVDAAKAASLEARRGAMGKK